LRYYSTATAATELGVARVTINRAIDAGRLKAVDISFDTSPRPRWRITAEALAEYRVSIEMLREPLVAAKAAAS
jgi:excisionase family DNA binding protein